MGLYSKEFMKILFDVFMAEEGEDEPTIFDILRDNLTPERFAESLAKNIDCESCKIRCFIKCTSRENCYENCLRAMNTKLSDVEKLSGEHTDEPEEDT